MAISGCEEYLALRVAISVEFEHQAHRFFSAHIKCDDRIS